MSFHAGQSFTFGETPSATKWNYLWDNDYALQDWTAFTNATFPVALLSAGSVTAAKLVSDAIGHGYLEIARTTLGSAGDTITVSSIPAYKYLYVVGLGKATGGTLDTNVIFNNDTGNNYAQKYTASYSGTPTDAANTNQLLIESGSTVTNGVQFFNMEFANPNDRDKIGFGNDCSQGTAADDTTTPVRLDWNFVYDTSTEVTRIDWRNGGTGDFAIGSEVVVYGHD